MIRFQRDGELACYLCGLLRRLRAVQRGVQVDALAATRNRYRVVPDVAQDVAYQHCNPSALGQRHAWAGIEIKDQTVGILRIPIGSEAPLRHVNLQGGELRQPAESRKIVDHWIVVVVILVRDRPPRHPIRGARTQVLVEEDGRPLSLHFADAVGPAFAGCRPITQMRQHGRPNLSVIGQDIGFGGLSFGDRAPCPSW